MIEFPIEEIYRRVAKIDVLRNDINSVIGHGSGFFYRYDDRIFFVTNRSYIIVEERAFLPDSVVLYPNIETKALGKNGIALQLYDKKEKPTWQLLPTKTSEQFVSIPVPNEISQLDFIQFFLSPLEEFPSKVLLPIGEFTLTIPVQTCVSLANYFFYSQPSDEKTIKNEIENTRVFKINRKGFARDMIEMVLLLMERNLFLMKNFEQNSQTEDATNYNQVHQNLVKELEKIISQFEDLLEPSVFERVQNIFNIVRKENFMEDYLIVNHLINRVLSQLGNNIYYMQ